MNWNVCLDPDVAATLSPEFLDLLQYRAGYVNLPVLQRATSALT